MGMAAEETVADDEQMGVMIEQGMEKNTRGAEAFQVLLGIAYFTTIFTILGQNWNTFMILWNDTTLWRI